MTPTILLTGGTGKTNTPLAHLFSLTANRVILLSRSGTVPSDLITSSGGRSNSGNDVNNIYGVKFDWFDRSTWDAPFKFTEEHKFTPIDRVFLVGPVLVDYTFMNDFVDFARERGVKRFVLLSASHTGSDDISMGQTHKYLEELPIGSVEYVVLRPTWFIENFGQFLAGMIRDDDKIYSVAEDGKVPYISAQEIAEVAYKALMDDSPSRRNGDLYIHGPELLTYDELADIFSSILGRKITYVRMKKEEYIQYCDRLGYSVFSQRLYENQLKIAKGSEEAIFGHEKAVIGKVTLKEYVEKNKDIWMKESKTS